jgi:hypothetical protein
MLVFQSETQTTVCDGVLFFVKERGLIETISTILGESR